MELLRLALLASEVRDPSRLRGLLATTQSGTFPDLMFRRRYVLLLEARDVPLLRARLPMDGQTVLSTPFSLPSPPSRVVRVVAPNRVAA